MHKTLYVGNLGDNVTSTDLRQLFDPHGTVQSAQVVENRGGGGRSRGFGFVKMGSEAEAQAAIAAMNGKEQDGRALIVKEAKPKESPGEGGYGSRGGYGGYSGRR